MNTIIEIIESRFESNKNRTIFTYLEDGETAERRLSLAEIRTDARKFAPRLAPGATVLILLPQGVSFIKAFFGCLYARAIGVPLALPGKHRGFEKLRDIARDAGARIGVTNRATLASLTRWFGEDFLRFGVEWLLIEEIESAAETTTLALPEPAEIAFLQYTSGSTSRPKAVMVTHENILANSRIIREFFQNDETSSSVCWLPSFHDMGLIDGIVQPVFSDFPCVLMSPAHFLQKPARWLKALTRYGATYSGGPNFAFDLCANRIRDDELAEIDLSRVRCLYNGSEPIRPRTLERFLARFSAVGLTREKLFTCYGLAEATLAATASRLGAPPVVAKIDAEDFLKKKITFTSSESEPHVELVGSGRIYGDTKLKIVEPETERACGEREIGEIWVAGRSIAAGYWRAPEMTAAAFVTEDGVRYLKTGDLGFLSGGELFVTGRLKDLIVIRGKNHAPQDIEQTVAASHECLQPDAAAAFSSEIEADEKLVVVQEIKRTCLNRADLTGIFSSVLADLSRHHGLVPHEIVLLYPAGLPKTSSGKIQRQASRKLWFEKKLNALAVWSERQIIENVTYENTGGNSFLATGANRRRN